jgi:hypothetical protein
MRCQKYAPKSCKLRKSCLRYFYLRAAKDGGTGLVGLGPEVTTGDGSWIATGVTRWFEVLQIDQKELPEEGHHGW